MLATEISQPVLTELTMKGARNAEPLVEGGSTDRHARLRAVDLFDDRMLSSMRTTPVASFTAERPGSRKLEADFALFWQQSYFGELRSGILFGECKTFGVFDDKDVRRMRFLAKQFPGASLAFCTLRKSLTTREIRLIKGLAKSCRKYWKADQPTHPILVLTGNELLANMRPPYCWDEATKSKFTRVAGLLEMANATQQIYLGLPPWENDWREEWQKRRERAQTKQTIVGPTGSGLLST